MKRRVLITLVSLVSILAVVVVYFGLYGRESSEINVKTSAASGSATLTSQAEWEAGTLDNIDSTATPGDMEVDEKGNAELTITESMLSANAYESEVNHVLIEDGNNWGDALRTTMYDDIYVEVDLGQNYSLSRFRTKYISQDVQLWIQTSEDGISYTTQINNIPISATLNGLMKHFYLL